MSASDSAGDVCYKVFTGVKLCSQNMNKSTLHWHHRCPAGLPTVVPCKNSTAGGSAESSLRLCMAGWAAEGMRDVNAVGFPEPTDLNQLCYISIHSAKKKKIIWTTNGKLISPANIYSWSFAW